MPILDQGYQHWNGTLAGHAGRCLVITRRGVGVQFKNRWVQWILLAALAPALVLAGFLVVWGLFEQKSSLLTPFLFLVQGLPPELRAGPRGFRSTFWTLAFDQFFQIQLFFSMILVLLVGPELISQDLRFNAMPLYFSRPVRRIDYFLGKFGVIAAYLGGVTILPTMLAYALGIGFSLDPSTLGDTWRVLLGSLVYGVIVVLSAGTLMLAISSLSRNSRHVAAVWLGLWILSNVGANVLEQTIERPWCPLVSYTGNLNRIREALLDTRSARAQVRGLFQAGERMGMDAAGSTGFGRRGRRGGLADASAHPPLSPASPRPGMVGGAVPASGAGEEPGSGYPWPWSALVLLGLGGGSVWTLSTRVRSLDQLR
jgi:ABC-2 type transport system permease protein